MEPNYQQQPPQPGPGVDYLNAIAPKAPVKMINPFVLWGGIAAALILVIVIVMALAGGGASTDSLLARVGASTNSLKELSDGADEYIQSSQLRTLNSSLSLTLANTNRDLSTALKAKKITVTNAKKNKTVAEVINEYEDMASRLEDARLNGVYDRTYAREVAYQLKTLSSYMGQLYSSTNSASLKDALETNDDNLAPLLKEFENFNAS